MLVSGMPVETMSLTGESATVGQGVQDTPHGVCHAGVFAVSWQAHGGEPVLDAFWAVCSEGDVAITGSLHGALCFWSAAHLLEAACLQQSNRVIPQLARHAQLKA